MKAGFRSKDAFVFFMLYRYSASRILEYFKKNVGKQEFLKKRTRKNTEGERECKSQEMKRRKAYNNRFNLTRTLASFLLNAYTKRRKLRLK